MPIPAHLLGIKSPAVVLHHQADPLWAFHEQDGDLAGLGVADGVGQSLLDHPEEGGLLFRMEAVAELVHHLDLNPGLFGNLAG